MKKLPPLFAAAFAAAAALLLSSCWRPIFDERISSGAFFYDRIGSPFRTIGPVSMYNDMTGGEFLPERIYDPYNGFWVIRNNGSIGVNYIKYTAGSGYSLVTVNGAATSVATSGGDLAFARSAYYNSSNPELLFGQSGSVSTAALYLLTYDTTTDSFFSPTTTNFSPTASGIIAMGATQAPGSGTDNVAVFYTGASQLYAAVATATTTGLTTPSAGAQVPLGPYTLASYGRVFPELSGTTVVGLYYSAGGGQVLHWDWDSGSATITSSAPSVLRVDEPLVAVLSDGTLVCQGQDYLSAYKPDGTRIFSVLAGSVRFVHEVDNSGIDYCIFAQVLVAPSSGHGGDNDVYVELWRIPTSSFASLGT